MKEFVLDMYYRVKQLFNTIGHLYKWNKMLYDIYMNEADEFLIAYKTDLASFKFIERKLNEYYNMFIEAGWSLESEIANRRALKVLQKLLVEIINEDYCDKKVNTSNMHRFLSDDYSKLEKDDVFLQTRLREEKVKHLYNKIRTERLDYLWF